MYLFFLIFEHIVLLTKKFTQGFLMIDHFELPEKPESLPARSLLNTRSRNCTNLKSDL